MTRFNWDKIKKICKYDPPTIVSFLRWCTTISTKGKLPPKLRRLTLYGVPKGSSYMLNLKELLEDKAASSFDIVQYIELCSRRNYVEYKFNRVTTLPSVVAYDTNVQYNRLITVENRQILFKYETEEK